MSGEEGGASRIPIAIATLAAFASGYAAIAFLLRFLAAHGLGVFVAYRVAVGTAVLTPTAPAIIT